MSALAFYPLLPSLLLRLLRPTPALTFDLLRRAADKKQPAKKAAQGEVAPAAAPEPKDAGFTFELFVSTAILQQNKDHILACQDMADVFSFING